MKKFIRSAVTICAVALVSWGPAAAASAQVSASPPAQVVDAPILPAGETLWQWYEGPFKSKATCEARAKVIRSIYGGTHHGAINKTLCQTGPLMTCPAANGMVLYVKKVIVETGPLVAPPTGTDLAAGAPPFNLTCA